MKTSKAGVDFIKGYESLRLRAYLCPAGVWTIGYGHTNGVREGDTCTVLQAEQFLRDDLAASEMAVLAAVKVPLAQSQFDALVSFVFNVGVGAFKRSTLLRRVNAGAYSEVPAQLMRWNKSNGKVINGLTNRRAAEGRLWQSAIVVDEEMPQAVDAPSKPLAQSRTMIGSAVGVAGSGAVVAGDVATQVSSYIKANQEDFTILGLPMATLLTVAAVCAVVGGLVAMWARWDDARKGRL